VRLYSRPGNDLTWRFPLIVEALARLRAGSCILDGEAVSCGPDGIAAFDRIRYRRHDADVFMWAFELICWRERPRASASTSSWTRKTGRSCSSTPASSVI
jgi:ATP-dependent DNA ligase